METALSTITNLPCTKKEIHTFKQAVMTELESGMYNVLDIAVKFKALEKLLESIMAEPSYKEMAVKQAEINGSNYEYGNAKIEIIETGKYSFEGCNDSELKSLEVEQSRIDGLVKARKEFLKTLSESLVDTSTGEIIHRPIKTSNQTIKITLK